MVDRWCNMCSAIRVGPSCTCDFTIVVQQVLESPHISFEFKQFETGVGTDKRTQTAPCVSL
jgi:hypothetical protein